MDYTNFFKESDVGRNRDIDMPKLRGSMLAWSRKVDSIECPSESPKAEYVFEEFMEFMLSKIDKFERIFKYAENKDYDRSDKFNRITEDKAVDEMRKLYKNNEEFRNNVKEKFTSVDNENDTNGEATSGSGDSGDNSRNTVRGDDSGDRGVEDYGGPLGSIVDVGILTPDKNVNKNKIRGAMLKFSEEVDAVEGTEMEPNYSEAKEAFNRWMLDKFGSEWVNFITRYLEPGKLDDISEAMYERNEQYRSNVENKWEYAPGNLKEGGGDDDTRQESDGKPGGNISEWSDYVDSDGQTRDGDSDGGDGDVDDTDSSDGGISDRLRYKKYEDVKADSDDMWDLDEIRNTIIRENVWTALDKIPSNVVDTVVTSPPYWNLRDYDGEKFAPIGGNPDCEHKFHKGRCYKCNAWRGQLGHEPEPEMFIDNIVCIFQKIRRILKPGGSVFLNVGDNYARQDFLGEVRCKRKSMMAIPERIYIKMMEAGWVSRNKIVWCKRILFDDDTVKGAANPTSVVDRINHTWEPMWWLASEPDYYSDIYAVRREHQTEAQDMSDYSGKYDEEEIEDEMYNSPTARAAREGYDPSFQHEEGANIPDVWRVPTGSAGKEHPAVYSPRLPVRPIKMTCPKYVCSNCLTAYKRVTEDGETKEWKQTCSCHTDETKSGIVFDPFCGRGTTAKSAEDEGRDWITTEVSDKYADFAEDYISGAKRTQLTEFNQ